MCKATFMFANLKKCKGPIVHHTRFRYIPFTFFCLECQYSALPCLPIFPHPKWNRKLLSPVCCVVVLCSCIGDLLSILHPEAFFGGSLSSGEVTLQYKWFASAVQWENDLIGGIDLWFCKKETVKPYHRTVTLKHLKCFHPCCISCRLYAVFIWSV